MRTAHEDIMPSRRLNKGEFTWVDANRSSVLFVERLEPVNEASVEQVVHVGDRGRSGRYRARKPRERMEIDIVDGCTADLNDES